MPGLETYFIEVSAQVSLKVATSIKKSESLTLLKLFF